MADSAVATTGHDVHTHHELGFWRTYIFSTDHKMIGRQFLFLGLFMLVIGGTLADTLDRAGHPSKNHW